MYNKSNRIYRIKLREDNMYRKLFLATVLATFTIGVSVGQGSSNLTAGTL